MRTTPMDPLERLLRIVRDDRITLAGEVLAVRAGHDEVARRPDLRRGEGPLRGTGLPIEACMRGGIGAARAVNRRAEPATDTGVAAVRARLARLRFGEKPAR